MTTQDKAGKQGLRGMELPATLFNSQPAVAAASAAARPRRFMFASRILPRE
jgi:hypothetical protein